MDFFPSRHIARDTLDDLLISIVVAVATVMAAGLLDRVWELGHFGGSGMMVCLPARQGGSTGATRLIDQRTAWALGATALAISAKCRFMASVLQAGRIRAAPLPSCGQTAAKM